MPDDQLEPVLEIVTTLARKAAEGGYIFRGEPECYERVSSRLYREYAEIGDLDVASLQDQMLSDAWDYTDEENDDIILAQLQHFGGSTNLIDFTTDYLVAFFFACDGSPEQDGRVVLLATSEEMSEYIWSPSSPVNRVIAQKSVFVEHPEGFVQPDDEVIIPQNLKLSVLNYLENCHDIDAVTIYNDLYGFIRYRSLHHEALVNFSAGIACQNNGDHQSAIGYFTKSIELNPQYAVAYNNRGRSRIHNGDYTRAIQDYTRAIELNRDYAETYCNRGEAWLHLGEWENAKSDLIAAKGLGYDIAASFHNDYENVAAFEQQHGIQVPPDIAEMLGG